MTTTLEKRNTLKAALSREATTFIDSIIKTDPKFYFQDGFVAELMAEGYPVQEATKAWATSYSGANSFVKDVAAKLAAGKDPSLKQARALLNCAVKDAQEKAPTSSVVEADDETIVMPFPEPTHACFVCGEKFYTVKEAANHRVKTHVGASSLEPSRRPASRSDDWATRIRECKGCDFKGTLAELREHRKEHYNPLFEGVPQSGLDLTTIPEGRYAVPDLSGTDFIFLSVAKVHKTKERSKKFRFGWISYGNEEVLAGTLEVRRWRGETKELIGEQRPGETYRGDYLDEWRMILTDPVSSMKLFGVIHERCGRCGTSLTDPESRRRAIGPECIKHYNDPKVLAPAASKEDLTERLMSLRAGSTTPAAFIKAPAPTPAPAPFSVAGFGSVDPEPETPLLSPRGWDD